MTKLLFFKENLPFNLELVPHTAYLVGGAVRDALLQRQGEYLDLDFVLPTDAVKIARKIARTYQAGFVVLDAERQIARVVFKEATVDFAQQEGETLTQDLQRRDFTINAIAYHLQTEQLIDPFGGREDLNNGIIRMVSEANLQDDPLRLLRAYRQASQLDFTIEPQTRLALEKLAPLLTKVAAERIRTELAYLLATSEGTRWLREAYHDGLLSVWLKNVTAYKIERLVKIDAAAVWMGENWTQFQQKKESWYYLAKLASLVSPEAAMAEAELVNLKYSRAEIRTVTTALKYLPQLLNINPPMSLRQQYFFFLAVGEVFPLVAVLAIASGIEQQLIILLIDRYLDSNDPVAHPQPLVTGNELIKALHVPPSPKIGELLSAIQLAYIEGKISTPDRAITYAASLLESQSDVS
jgi:tRNA nucleotidyltransferase (CCA-adding enzyme)